MSSPARTKNSVAIFRNHMLPFNKLLRFKYGIAQLPVTCCNCVNIFILLHCHCYWHVLMYLLFTFLTKHCKNFFSLYAACTVFSFWLWQASVTFDTTQTKCIVSKVPTVLFWQNLFCVIDKPFDQYTKRLTPFCSDADHIAGSYSHVYKLIKLGWLHYLRSRLHTQHGTIWHYVQTLQFPLQFSSMSGCQNISHRVGRSQ